MFAVLLGCAACCVGHWALNAGICTAVVSLCRALAQVSFPAQTFAHGYGVSKQGMCAAQVLRLLSTACGVRRGRGGCIPHAENRPLAVTHTAAPPASGLVSRLHCVSASSRPCLPLFNPVLSCQQQQRCLSPHFLRRAGFLEKTAPPPRAARTAYVIRRVRLRGVRPFVSWMLQLDPPVCLVAAAPLPLPLQRCVPCASRGFP